MTLVVAVILIPGWLLARSFGMSSLDALGVSPASGLSIFIVAASGADILGLKWTVFVGVMLLVIVTAAMTGLGRLVNPPSGHGKGLSAKQMMAVAGSVTLAMVVMAWQFMSGTGEPDALAQMPDAPFHLLAVADLVESHSASPWRSGDVLWYMPGHFYPGAFHSVAATPAAWLSVDVDVACHATLLAFTAVFWPLSLLVLAYTTVPRSAWIYFGAGVLALATTYSPLVMMPGGAAWANAASASLLAALLIPLMRLAHEERPPPARQFISSGVLMLAMALAAALCQPNSLFALVLVGLPLIGPRAFSWGRGWALSWVCAVLGAVVVWVVFFPPSAHDVPVVGDVDLRRSLLLVLKGGDVPLIAGVPILLLTGVGLFQGLRRISLAGVVFAWVVTFFMLLAVVFETPFEVQRVAWPWYSGAQRLSVVWAVPAYLMAVLGWSWIVRSARSAAPVVSSPLLAVGITVLAVGSVPAVHQLRDAVHFSYYPRDLEFVYITNSEVADLQQLATDIPPGGATALDPFRGGMYLGMFGRKTLPLVPFSNNTTQGELIDESLNTAASDPEVCAAVRQLGVTHVLTGGSRAKFWSSLDPRAPGIDAAPDAEGFTLVAAAGPYVLYQVPLKCQS